MAEKKEGLFGKKKTPPPPPPRQGMAGNMGARIRLVEEKINNIK